MIVDLHSHLPMHLTPTGPGGVSGGAGLMRDRWRHTLVSMVGHLGNFEGRPGRPRVTVPLLRQGRVGVALSVAYLPMEEMIFSPQWHLWEMRRRDRRFHWAPPSRRAFGRLLRQMDSTERHVADRAGDAVLVRSEAELDHALSDGKLAVIHCVEGAFHISSARSIDGAVAELARRGVAYLTVGHLFFRGVATVTPAWAEMSDERWDRIYPQPEVGLTEPARAVVRALVREGIVIDVCHLRADALEETFDLLDEVDPERSSPVIASHVALRLGELAYNLSDASVQRIAARNGVIGMIASAPHLSDGSAERPGAYEQTLELMFRHIDRTYELTGSHRHAAIGSDLGGFIQVAPGLENAGRLGALEDAIIERYGPGDGELICSGNAIRLLRWRFATGEERAVATA